MRDTSLRFQQQLIEERRLANAATSTYQPGDLVLWDPVDTGPRLKAEKLAPKYQGPFRVVYQVKNDIECYHVVTLEQRTLHVERVKPFFGSDEDAIRVGKLDKDQFGIMSINYYRGNPHVRISLPFNITFEDSDTKLVPYSTDLADSEPFKVYCSSRNELHILLMTRAEARLYISNINRTEFHGYQTGDLAYLSLRYFDGVDREWYGSLVLPNPSRSSYVEVTVSKIHSGRRPTVLLHCTLFNAFYKLPTYDATVHLHRTLDPLLMQILDNSFRISHPQVFH